MELNETAGHELAHHDIDNLELENTSVDWLLALGYVYIQTHKFTRAMSVLSAVLANDSSQADALKMVSYAYFKMGKFEKAFSYIKRWMSVPGSTRKERIDMYLLQARVLLRLRRKDLAKKCLYKYKTLVDEENKVNQRFIEQLQQANKRKANRRR